MESGLILDFSMTLSSCDDPLSDIKPILDKFHSLLNSAIYISDNNENSLFRLTGGGEEER